MTVYPTPEFTRKVVDLPEEYRREVKRAIDFISSSSKDELLNARLHFQTKCIAENLYQIRLRDIRIFFSFGGTSENDLLLLDLNTHSATPSATKAFFAVNDPRTNSSLNPKFNSSLNPKFNSSLNPRYNSSINPRYNSSINPRYNSSINPRYNSSINPRYNSSINPRYNSSINPRYNSSINPRSNRSFGGPFIYSIDLIQQGFLVRANDSVSLKFDLAGEFAGTLIKANDKVLAEFDTDQNWVGFCVQANDLVQLKFDEESEWNGLVV